MSKITPEIIACRLATDISHGAKNLESMGKKAFGEKWLGFVKETTFIHSEGFITKKIIPIQGTPAQEFRNAMEAAGLVGETFDKPKKKPKIISAKEAMERARRFK